MLAAQRIQKKILKKFLIFNLRQALNEQSKTSEGRQLERYMRAAFETHTEINKIDVSEHFDPAPYILYAYLFISYDVQDLKRYAINN